MDCPRCNASVEKQNINIQANIAQCQNCDAIFRISDHLDERESVVDGFDLNKPPQGAWIRNEMNQLVMGATTRTRIAIFLVPFMVVWSGFSIGGLYGIQLVKGEFDPFLSLFGIPFLLGSVFFWGITLMAIWGKVELTLDKRGGSVFTGIGSVGISKRFTWVEISTVREKQSTFSYPGSQGGTIQLDGIRRITFGLGVKDNRRYYLYRALRSILSNVKAKKSFV